MQRTTLLITVALCAALAACDTSPVDAQAEDPVEPWNWSEDFVRSAVNQVRAGRDLNPASWPDGARVRGAAVLRRRQRDRPRTSHGPSQHRPSLTRSIRLARCTSSCRASHGRREHSLVVSFFPRGA